MRKIIRLFMLIVILHISCNDKVINVKPTEIEKFDTMSPVDIDWLFSEFISSDYEKLFNYSLVDIFMFISNIDLMMPNDEPKDPLGLVRSEGFIRSEKLPNYIYGGIMTLSNLEYDTDERHEYYYGSPASVCFPGDTIDTRIPDFGKISKWGITGDKDNSLEPFTKEMYVPKFLYCWYNNDADDPTTISLKDKITIKWTQDNDNKNDIWIVVDYDSEMNNKYIDSNLPDHDYFWYKNIPDNGSYVLDFEHFDFMTGSTIHVHIIRGNEFFEIINDKKVYIGALHRSYTWFDIVE